MARKKIERTPWVETPTPYQMCQRYAAGTVTADDLVEYLGAYAYAPEVTGIGVDDELLIFMPSSWMEIEAARVHGVIDDLIYEKVLQLRYQH